jgi:hypothetical protein
LVGKLPALLKFSVGETRKIGRWFIQLNSVLIFGFKKEINGLWG